MKSGTLTNLPASFLFLLPLFRFLVVRASVNEVAECANQREDHKHSESDGQCQRHSAGPLRAVPAARSVYCVARPIMHGSRFGEGTWQRTAGNISRERTRTRGLKSPRYI